jgi:putative transposase
MEWFRGRAEARVLIEIWGRHYNAVRPHSSLDYRTPRDVITNPPHQGATIK